MVCDAAVVINLVASALMNTVCCLHSLHSDEVKQRQQEEHIKRTINVEYERQRLHDRERQEQLRKEKEIYHRALLEEQRRRMLMETKLQYLSSSFSSRSSRSTSSRSRHSDCYDDGDDRERRVEMQQHQRGTTPQQHPQQQQPNYNFNQEERSVSSPCSTMNSKDKRDLYGSPKTNRMNQSFYRDHRHHQTRSPPAVIGGARRQRGTLSLSPLSTTTSSSYSLSSSGGRGRNRHYESEYAPIRKTIPSLLDDTDDHDDMDNDNEDDDDDNEEVEVVLKEANKTHLHHHHQHRHLHDCDSTTIEKLRPKPQGFENWKSQMTEETLLTSSSSLSLIPPSVTMRRGQSSP